MQKIFITATGTSIGKTWIAAALAYQFWQKGVKVQTLKPIVTGWNSKENDSRILLEATGLTASEENIQKCSPWRFKAAISADLAAAREGAKINFQDVVDFCDRDFAGIKLIESAGGIMSPLNADKTFLDLAKALNYKIILVAGSYLGAISHTLTALKALDGFDVQLIINESAKNPVSLGQTAASISRFSKVPLTLVPRAKSWKELPDLTGIIA